MLLPSFVFVVVVVLDFVSVCTPGWPRACRDPPVSPLPAPPPILPQLSDTLLTLRHQILWLYDNVGICD